MVIDITGVPNVDEAVANSLVDTVTASRLMGADVIITGLSSEIAQTLVTIGVDLSKMHTVGDLQGGIEEAERQLGFRVIEGAGCRLTPPTAPRTPLPASILSQGPNLIVSIHAALDDEQLVRLQRDLLERVGRNRSRGVLIDVAALDVLDSFAARTLARPGLHGRAARSPDRRGRDRARRSRWRWCASAVRMPLTQTALDLEEGLAWLGS